MTAYYNEFDPNAAAWLRELIANNLIAPGDVDTRSIEDVKPSELRGYKQCHFFAGIGVWSYALRRAGWSDDRPVWTGSCPCQPFSTAGKGDGFTDERHLWPHWHHLIRQCQPDRIFGEQVASKDGLAWLDLVYSDMEGTGYAIGATDLCAAGFGAPHIRQRLFFGAIRLADADCNGCGQGRERIASIGGDGSVGNSTTVRLDNPNVERLEGLGWGYQTEGWREGKVRPTSETSESGGLAQPHSGERDWLADGQGRQPNGPQTGREQGDGQPEPHRDTDRPSTPHNAWRDADWLYCRDGKWRPVESGTFPLAHGSPARVVRLRGYGNAIVAQVAENFIRATM